MLTKLKKIFTFTKSDWLALLAIAGVLLWQFGTYFISKPLLGDLHVMNGEIDKYIPLVKYFAIFYVALYITIIVVPFMISRRDRKMFHIYIWTYFLMFSAALITFIIYPTTVEIPKVESADIWSSLLNLIYTLDDPPVNEVPSGHTMACTAMIYATLLCRNMKPSTKAVFSIINVLTIMSTVFTKQHAFMDVVIGIIYTTIIFLIVWLVYRKIDKRS